jgi:glutamate transport system permease protein
MSSVLFDNPGPRARRRHQLATALSLLIFLLIAAWVGSRLYQTGSLTPEVFNGTFQNRNVEYLLGGLASTLQAAVLAIASAILFGLVFALGRLSDHTLLRWVSGAVVEFFRAVPLVLLIIGIWFAYKDIIGSLGSLVAALTLYNGAVLAEVFRAGITAVPSGQSAAALAIGMRKVQVLRFVLVPQAVKFMLPSIISQCTVILKDTSLGYLILYAEAVRRAKDIARFVDQGAVLTYVTVAIVFVLLNYALTKLAEHLEHRLSTRTDRRPVAALDPAA